MYIDNQFSCGVSTPMTPLQKPFVLACGTQVSLLAYQSAMVMKSSEDPGVRTACTHMQLQVLKFKARATVLIAPKWNGTFIYGCPLPPAINIWSVVTPWAAGQYNILVVQLNRWFAWWCNLTTTTSILHIFCFICLLVHLLFRPQWDFKI